MITKNDAAKYVMDAKTGLNKEAISFDCALPQSFVDNARAAGYDVRPHFVWAYPKGDIWGLAFPITKAGFDMAQSGGFADIDGIKCLVDIFRIKCLQFERGAYAFPVPPVNTRGWNRGDWLKWIDYAGSWHAGFLL